MYKSLRLTNCDSPMYEKLEKNPQELKFQPPKKYKCCFFFYFESKFNKYVSNIKQTWSTINEVLNKCKNKK